MRYSTSKTLAPLALVVAILMAGCDINQRVVPTPTPSPTALPTATAAPPTPAPTETAPPGPTVAIVSTDTPVEVASPTVAEAPSPVATPSGVARTGNRAASCAGMEQGSGDGIGDELFPQLGNPGYDALHYTLDLLADVPTGSISGTATMQAQTLRDLPGFDLDFLGPAIAALTVDGRPARYTREGRELK